MKYSHIIAALLFYVMSMSAMLPAGFMPGQGDNGQTIIICIGAFQAEVPVNDNDTHPTEAAHDNAPCAFSSVLSLDITTAPIIAGQMADHVMRPQMFGQATSQSSHYFYAERAPPTFI